MEDRKDREQKMSDEKSQAVIDIVVQNFGSKIDREQMSKAKIRCLYDCDCTVVGGTDPIPPLGTAAGVGGYLAGTLI
jgi:hypothetical protein